MADEILRSKHGFGNLSGVAAALEAGKIDAYDILFLDGDTKPKVGWIDKNSNFRLVDTECVIVANNGLPTSGVEGKVYIFNDEGYFWNGKKFVNFCKPTDVTDLEDRLTGLETRATDLETRSTALEALTTELVTNLGEANVAIVDLRTELDALKVEVESVKTEVDGAKADIADSKEEIETLKSDVSELQTNVEDLQTGISDLQAEVEKKANAEDVKADIEKAKTEVIEDAKAYTDEKVEDVLDEAKHLFEKVKYEITNTPVGTLVDYREKEIRVMCPVGTQFEKQNVGATGNANMYYMAFKAYAPEGAVSFKEGDKGVIVDEMFTFDNDFAGTDEFGRNYSICWLALASYDGSNWTYFGKNSSTNKYIGWTYVVEWYNADGVVIASDSIRINLSNEECHSVIEPYYVPSLIDKAVETANAYTDEQIAAKIVEAFTIVEF